MNKKILISVLFLLIFTSFAYARICDSGDISDVLRKALYTYYKDKSNFTKTDLRELLTFYLSIGSDEITVDCTEQNDIINLAITLPDNIPSCSDGTKYGKCSNNNPMYCYAGRLVPRCMLCGCPEGQYCDVTYVYTEKGNKGRWGKCYPIDGTNVTCSVNSDCGVSDYVGDYYCQDRDVYRSYIKHTCLNPGETNSDCVTNQITVLIEDCEGEERCIAGQSECQVVSDGPPTVTISIAPTIVAEGETFNVTVTGTDDIGLKAVWWWGDGTTDTELNKAHWFECNDAKTCSNTWFVSTNALGTLTLGANSRDDAYPVPGKPHQASEGEGIAYATITITSKILKCSDGTPYGQCSTIKPKYCDDGILINNCPTCGCPSGTSCKPDGSCGEKTKLKCVSQSTYSKECDRCVWSCDNYYDDCDKRCNDDDLFVSISKRSNCYIVQDKCRIYCRQVYYTGCGFNPSCKPGYDQVDTQSCTEECTEDWECTAWNTCINGEQTRTCTEYNGCGTVKNKPSETRTCCIENWQCTAWSECGYGDYYQYRTCTELNNCDTQFNKPDEKQDCPPCQPGTYCA